MKDKGYLKRISKAKIDNIKSGSDLDKLQFIYQMKKKVLNETNFGKTKYNYFKEMIKEGVKFREKMNYNVSVPRYRHHFLLKNRSEIAQNKILFKEYSNKYLKLNCPNFDPSNEFSF